MSIQQELLPLPTAGEQERPNHPSGAPRRPKVKTIDRKQSLLVPLDVEALVAPDHKVRAIWELAGKMNLSRFEEQMVSVEGKAGRPSWDPRLLVSVWVLGAALVRAYEHPPASRENVERPPRRVRATDVSPR